MILRSASSGPTSDSLGDKHFTADHCFRGAKPIVKRAFLENASSWIQFVCTCLCLDKAARPHLQQTGGPLRRPGCDTTDQALARPDPLAHQRGERLIVDSRFVDSVSGGMHPSDHRSFEFFLEFPNQSAIGRFDSQLTRLDRDCPIE